MTLTYGQSLTEALVVSRDLAERSAIQQLIEYLLGRAPEIAGQLADVAVVA